MKYPFFSDLGRSGRGNPCRGVWRDSLVADVDSVLDEP